MPRKYYKVKIKRATTTVILCKIFVDTIFFWIRYLVRKCRTRLSSNEFSVRDKTVIKKNNYIPVL